MAGLSLLRTSINVEYRAHTCSKATFLHITCWLLNIMIPIIIVYETDGLWRKFAVYEEQADINFKHNYLIIFELNKPINSDLIVWSSFPKLNEALSSDSLRIPFVTCYEKDDNDDGKYDQLNINFSMPLQNDEDVIGVSLFLLFDYKLQDRLQLLSESLAYINYRNPVPGSGLSVLGKLIFQQKQPLIHHGRDMRFNKPLFEEDFNLEHILNEYLKRNLSTVIGQDTYYLWDVGRDVSNENFDLRATILYPAEMLIYRSGFWNLIKWAWIQYASVFLVIYYFIQKIRLFMFENNLVDTVLHHTKYPIPSLT